MSVAEFAEMLPMVEPRVNDTAQDFTRDVEKLRDTLKKNVDALTSVADKNDSMTAALAEYNKKSFDMLDAAPRTKEGLEKFLVDYAVMTHKTETFVVLSAAIDAIKDRLLDVIDMLRSIEVAPERASVKEQNIGFLTDNLAKLNACFEMKNNNFEYHTNIAQLNMCLEFYAKRGRIYNMITNSEKQVREAKEAQQKAV